MHIPSIYMYLLICIETHILYVYVYRPVYHVVELPGDQLASATQDASEVFIWDIGGKHQNENRQGLKMSLSIPRHKHEQMRVQDMIGLANGELALLLRGIGVYLCNTQVYIYICIYSPPPVIIAQIVARESVFKHISWTGMPCIYGDSVCVWSVRACGMCRRVQ